MLKNAGEQKEKSICIMVSFNMILKCIWIS